MGIYSVKRRVKTPKAKFDRTKPHVNIGRVIAISFFAAFLCAVPRAALASSDGWGQKISDEFHKVLSRVRKNNLRPIRVHFLPILQAKNECTQD